MIKSFILSVQITADDYQKIKDHLNGWYKIREDDFYSSTNRYRNSGFSIIRIFDFVNRSNRKIYFLTITVNPSKIKPLNVSGIIEGYEINTAALYEHIAHSLLPPLKRYPRFLLRSIIFSLNLTSEHASMYLQLFHKGFSLKPWNMNQHVFINNNEIDSVMANAETLDEMIQFNQKYVLNYRSKSASLNMLHYQIDAQSKIEGSHFKQPSTERTRCIHIELKVEKLKIQNLMKKYDIQNRKIYDFSKDGFLEELEKQLFTEYLGRITRKGDYINLREASRVINSSSMNSDKKRRLIDVLQLIADNNGVDNFIGAVSSGSVKDYTRLSSIEQYFRDYDNLGINPVLLPDSSAITFLENPLKLLENFYKYSFRRKYLANKSPKHTPAISKASTIHSISSNQLPSPIVPDEFDTLADVDF